MPTHFYFNTFSLNNCKPFIANSSAQSLHESIRTNNTKSHHRRVSHYKVILELLKGCKICKTAPCSLGRKRPSLDIHSVMKYDNCAQREPELPEKLTAPGELFMPKHREYATVSHNHGFLCLTILGNQVTFEDFICTNSLNVRSLFGRICH